MKHSLLLVLSLLLVAVPQTILAGPQNREPLDQVLDLLRQAKDSAEPLPLLNQARQELANSKPAPKGVAHVGKPVKRALEASGNEHKQHAMEAIDGAINTAKAGGDTKAKIENAISNVHALNDLKH